MGVSCRWAVLCMRGYKVTVWWVCGGRAGVLSLPSSVGVRPSPLGQWSEERSCMMLRWCAWRYLRLPLLSLSPSPSPFTPFPLPLSPHCPSLTSARPHARRRSALFPSHYQTHVHLPTWVMLGNFKSCSAARVNLYRDSLLLRLTFSGGFL